MAALAAAPVLAGGVGAATSGFSWLGALSTLASVGSTFFGQQATQTQAKAEQVATQTNAAIDSANASRQEAALRREAYLRKGTQIASSAANGGGGRGNVLDIMADTASEEQKAILGIRTSNQITQSLATSKVSASKTAAGQSKYAGILSGGAKILSGF